MILFQEPKSDIQKVTFRPRPARLRRKVRTALLAGQSLRDERVLQEHQEWLSQTSKLKVPALKPTLKKKQAYSDKKLFAVYVNMIESQGKFTFQQLIKSYFNNQNLSKENIKNFIIANAKVQKASGILPFTRSFASPFRKNKVLRDNNSLSNSAFSPQKAAGKCLNKYPMGYKASDLRYELVRNPLKQALLFLNQFKQRRSRSKPQ